jgi:hypothetical protein
MMDMGGSKIKGNKEGERESWWTDCKWRDKKQGKKKWRKIKEESMLRLILPHSHQHGQEISAVMF